MTLDAHLRSFPFLQHLRGFSVIIVYITIFTLFTVTVTFASHSACHLKAGRRQQEAQKM
jgi:hypothetical protein